MSIYINSQIIHIIVDVVIIIAVSFYFHKKNQHLQKKIKELEEKIEKQQNVINEHDTVLQSILYNMKKPIDIVNPTHSYNNEVVKESVKDIDVNADSILKESDQVKIEHGKSSDQVKIEHGKSSEEDLDKELQNELSELEESLNEVEK